MKYFHVDVFSSKPLAGNGLTVVFPEKEIDAKTMLKIAQEFNQFETIFIFPAREGKYPVRIFTVKEELEFAGHPIIGAGAVIHNIYYSSKKDADITLLAGSRAIDIKSEKVNDNFRVVMNQGQADFLLSLNIDQCKHVFTGLNLSIENLYPGYSVEIVSTGLPYLLLPLKESIDKIKISRSDFENILESLGAKFMYAFDPDNLECRTWDNLGVTEDVATGSAAGPLCAYLVKNKYKQKNEKIFLKQGRFVNRDSEIIGYISGNNSEVIIEGDVSLFSKGEII